MRQRQEGLYGVCFAITQNATRPFVTLTLRQLLADHRFKTAAPRQRWVGGFDHALRQTGQHVLQRRLFATPPARNGRQLQIFAEQRLRQRRHEAEQRIAFQKARTRRVGHQYIAAAHRLQQAGHAQRGLGVQFERVQPQVVHPLDQAVHRLQALQGFEEHVLVAHRQVRALHQGQAQVAGQVSVFKIGFVVRARREQGNVRMGPCGRALFEPVDPAAVCVGQALHWHGLKGLGELPRNDLPVFQQVAQARRRLSALRQQPPAAIRAARQVKGGQAQVLTAHRRHALHGVQITRMALHQRGRQLALRQQVLRTVGVGHDVFKQTHALQHTGLNLLPTQRIHHQREQVQRPRALRPIGVGIDVVGNPVVVNLALKLRHAGIQRGGAHVLQMRNELRPFAAQRRKASGASSGPCRLRLL